MFSSMSCYQFVHQKYASVRCCRYFTLNPLFCVGFCDFRIGYILILFGNRTIPLLPFMLRYRVKTLFICESLSWGICNEHPGCHEGDTPAHWPIEKAFFFLPQCHHPLAARNFTRQMRAATMPIFILGTAEELPFRQWDLWGKTSLF